MEISTSKSVAPSAVLDLGAILYTCPFTTLSGMAPTLIRAGMASFRSDRVSVTADGVPVVYDRVFIPGDRFRITRDLRYDQINTGDSPEEIES